MHLRTIALALLAGCSAAPAADLLEGFGAQTPGGRGGRLLVVANLNDSGPGSLREAVETKGPRTVTFRVAGEIHLRKALAIREPFLTLDAGSAPAPGVTLMDDSVFIRTHDVIIRHLRSRAGDKGQGKLADVHGFSLAEASNIVLDHCSAYWGIDENIGMYQCHDVTVQWCILAEGLFHSGHEKGPHSMGILMGGELNDRMSFHHNLLANNNQRNPRIQAGVADVRNNVIYNWGSAGAYYTGKMVANMIGNLYIPGPDSSRAHKPIVITPEVGLYLSDNRLLDQNSLTDWEMVQPPREGKLRRAEKPYAVPAVATVPVSKVYEVVLGQAGATGPVRDREDQRVVEGVRKRTGRIIDTPGQVR